MVISCPWGRVGPHAYSCVWATLSTTISYTRETCERSQMCSPQSKTKCDCITFTNHLFNRNASIRKAFSKSLDFLFQTLWAKSLIWMPMIDKIGCENFICKSEVPYFAFFSATVLVPVNKSLLCNYKCAIIPNVYVCVGTFELI